MKIKCYDSNENLIKEMNVENGLLINAPFTRIANDLKVVCLSPIYFQNSKEGLNTRLSLSLTQKEKEKLLKKLRICVKKKDKNYNYATLKLAEIFLNFKGNYKFLKGELIYLFNDSQIDNFIEIKDEIEEIENISEIEFVEEND